MAKNKLCEKPKLNQMARQRGERRTIIMGMEDWPFFGRHIINIK
jgi:hypothetical protein